MADDVGADMLALDLSRDRLVIVHHIEAIDLVAGEILARSAAGVSGVRPHNILSLAKRVPLTGEAATALTTVTDVDVANSHRNLVTDGVNLYWQDAQFVRKIPIRGGAVTVLDQASPNTPTAGLALQNGNVIYASVSAIRYLPVTGATTPPSARTIVTASERVTALHAVLGFVYWGEEGGAIRVVSSGSTPETISTITGLLPTSISTSVHGGVYAQAWTQCDSQSCRLHFDVPSGEDSLYVIDRGALGVSVALSGNVFWGDATGVHRHIPH